MRCSWILFAVVLISFPLQVSASGAPVLLEVADESDLFVRGVVEKVSREEECITSPLYIRFAPLKGRKDCFRHYVILIQDVRKGDLPDERIEVQVRSRPSPVDEFFSGPNTFYGEFSVGQQVNLALSGDEVSGWRVDWAADPVYFQKVVKVLPLLTFLRFAPALLIIEGILLILTIVSGIAKQHQIRWITLFRLSLTVFITLTIILLIVGWFIYSVGLSY